MEENTFYPNTPCLECTQKHFCTALSLANEFSYSDENEAFVIGELGCAILHCMVEYPDLASRIREARHFVQDETPEKVDWQGIYKTIKKKINEENSGN